MKKTARDNSTSIAHRPGYIRDVTLVYTWTRVPKLLDTTSPVSSSRDAWPYFLPLEKRVRETVMALYLNQAHLPIAREVVHVGGLTQCHVYPAEILRTALHLGAPRVIIAHNHPSTNPRPSLEDEQVFDELNKAGGLVGIEIVDSLVIVPGNFFSMTDSRRLKTIAAFKEERRRASGRRAGSRPLEASQDS